MRFLTSSGQNILKNGKQVEELFIVIQLPKHSAIIKTPRHSKSDTMEAKGNQLADAATKQAALNTHPVQPRGCPLLSINPANPVKDVLLQSQEIATKEEKLIWQQKGRILTPPHKYGLDVI